VLRPIANRPKNLDPNSAANGAAKQSAAGPQETQNVVSVLEEKANGM
jgi:hypothetical protein